VLYYLDLGICYYYSGEFQKSNQLFEKAERTIEELYTQSITNLASSFLLNDNVLPYSGEDYEDVYLNLFKCLNYLSMSQFDDALVEIRRVNEKIETLSLKYDNLITQLNKIQKSKTKFRKGTITFHNSALAKYLSLLMYRAGGKYDDANIDLQSIKTLWSLQPDIYNFSLPSAVTKSLDKPAVSKLDIISLVGKGPEKYAVGCKIDTYKDYIIVSRLGDNSFADRIPMDVKEGYHFKFSLPEIRERESRVKFVEVFIDGRKVGNLELIEDMGTVAVATFKVKQPIIYLKTILRTVGKGIAAQKQKKNIVKKTGDSLLGTLLAKTVNVAVDISENADLRCWRLMPGKCLIGEYPVSPGIHNIKIIYLDSYKHLIDVDELPEFEIKANGLNLIKSFSYN
jgi:hypothetical protein